MNWIIVEFQVVNSIFLTTMREQLKLLTHYQAKINIKLYTEEAITNEMGRFKEFLGSTVINMSSEH